MFPNLSLTHDLDLWSGDRRTRGITTTLDGSTTTGSSRVCPSAWRLGRTRWSRARSCSNSDTTTQPRSATLWRSVIAFRYDPCLFFLLPARLFFLLPANLFFLHIGDSLSCVQCLLYEIQRNMLADATEKRNASIKVVRYLYVPLFFPTRESAQEPQHQSDGERDRSRRGLDYNHICVRLPTHRLGKNSMNEP